MQKLKSLINKIYLVKMSIEIIVKGDPQASALASALIGLAALCEKYHSNCSVCPVHIERKNDAGIPHYLCNFGLYAVKEAQKFKDKKVITEEDVDKLDVHARNYTGPDASYAFEDTAIKLFMSKKKSTQ